MVGISKVEDHFVFEIQGMHKIWALKSEIKIPVDHVKQAYQDETQIKNFNLSKIIGTNVPYGLHAGTFYQNGGIIFMDVSNKKNAIIIDLEDEKYKQMIIEVEDTEQALALLNK